MNEVLGAAEPDLHGRAAGQRAGFARRHGAEDQRPRQPGDGDVLVAPVGDDAAAPGPARARWCCRARAGSTPSAIAPPRSRSTRRSRRTSRPSSTRTATSSWTRARRSAPGSWRPRRSRRTRASSCIADSDLFGDEAIRVGGNGVLAMDVDALADGRRGVLGPDVDRGRRQDHPHAQAGRGLVLRDHLPGAGAGDRRRRRGHARQAAQAPSARRQRSRGAAPDRGQEVRA